MRYLVLVALVCGCGSESKQADPPPPVVGNPWPVTDSVSPGLPPPAEDDGVTVYEIGPDVPLEQYHEN